VPSVTAYIDHVAPGTVELNTTKPLYDGEFTQLSWVSDNFEPKMLGQSDSPVLRELGERLRRSGMKIKVDAHLYKLRLEVIYDRATDQAVDWLTDAIEVACDAFCYCGAYSEVAIKPVPVYH
jgi:hypothetical protein